MKGDPYSMQINKSQTIRTCSALTLAGLSLAAALAGGHLVRGDEVNVAVHSPRGEDLALAGNDFGAGPDHDIHAVGDPQGSCLADLEDVAAPEGDVGLVDAGVVQDDGVGDDGVRDVLIPNHLAVLAHAVADHFAAAEHHFLAVDREVLLDFEEQVGVRQADAVARRRAVQVGILPAGKVEAHWAPSLDASGPAASGRPFTALLSP